MNASAARGSGSRAFDTSLIELKEWRDATAAALAAFRRWAIVARVIDEHAAARLAHLERRLAAERLTVACVAEYARGKSELINALFFADLGARLLPAEPGRDTLCPTEILYDPARAACIRLLPIETREGPQSLRELLADNAPWKEIAIDSASPESFAPAFESLAESLEVSAAEATNLGFAVEGAGRVTVPRWRYAIVNFPHPLLKGGLVILDTPGTRALAAEPELALNRVPDADAIVFMLAVDSGVTQADRDLWTDHIAPIGAGADARFIVLNKIDTLRDGIKGESQVLVEIDQQVRATAEALGVDPTRIFALSARQGFLARLDGDRDALMKSRLYRLEQALSQGLLHRRRHDHATVVRAETRSLLAETKALLDSRHAFMADQLQELGALQGKNQKLVDLLTRKAANERARLEQARQAMVGLRGVHGRQADELAKLLNPNDVRAAGIRAQAAVHEASFSRDIGGTLDAYFRDTRGRLDHAIAVIGEVKKLMATVSRKFYEEYGIGAVESPEFATDRFLVELGRLEELCNREFRSAASLFMRGRKALGAQFFDTVVLKVIVVFEIADREVRTWMNLFIRPLETQLTAFQEQANSRIEGMGRMHDAGSDLVARVEELEAMRSEVHDQRREWEAHHERLQALVDVAPQRSLA